MQIVLETPLSFHNVLRFNPTYTKRFTPLSTHSLKSHLECKSSAQRHDGVQPCMNRCTRVCIMYIDALWYTNFSLRYTCRRVWYFSFNIELLKPSNGWLMMGSWLNRETWTVMNKTWVWAESAEWEWVKRGWVNKEYADAYCMCNICNVHTQTLARTTCYADWYWMFVWVCLDWITTHEMCINTHFVFVVFVFWILNISLNIYISTGMSWLTVHRIHFLRYIKEHIQIMIIANRHTEIKLEKYYDWFFFSR